MASSPASKTSSAPAAVAELSLQITPADNAALREASRPRPMSPADYEKFLAQFTIPYEALRARKGPCGPERFTL
jgi:hypothetical protein